MTIKKSGHRLFEQLQRLFIKESFKTEISKYRKEIGIPVDGFNSNEKYIDWIKKNKTSFFKIQSARVHISNQFSLPLHYSFWIESYLLIGNKFKEYNPEIPLGISFSRGFEKPSFGCALEKDQDFQCVNIKIFPGASYREIAKYVQENMGEIKDFLNTFDRKTYPVRKKRQSERDSKIYECYKKGWLNRYGEIINVGLIPDFIKKIDMDMIRKIIGEQIKTRK